MSEPNSTPLDDTVLDIQRIRQATRQMVRDLGFMEGTFLKTGCSQPEIHTLLELESAGAQAVSRLSASLRQDKSTASRNIKALVERGLVRKFPDPEDRRAQHLSLTTAGEEQVAMINGLANAQVREALAALDSEQRKRAIEGLELYARALERGCRLFQIQCRPIEEADNEAMGNVIRRVMTEFGAVGVGYSIEDAEVSSMFASYRVDRARFFVAVQDGVLLGGAGIGPLQGADDSICELRKMYLLPEGRGIGLGRKLLMLCLEAAREFGYSECYLETLSQLSQARQLYSKCGFEPLSAPKGDTGHFRCDSWSAKKL